MCSCVQLCSAWLWLSPLPQKHSAGKKVVSHGGLQKLLQSLQSRSSWRCSVRPGSAPSALCSALCSSLHCWHQHHMDYGFESCSLAQSLGFDRAEISALQNCPHSNSFTTVSSEWDFLACVPWQGECGTEASRQMYLLLMKPLRLFSSCPWRHRCNP